MPTTHSHTSFTVFNLERSVDFYTRLLGFKEEFRLDVQGPGIEQITGLPGARLSICMVTLDGFRLELIQYLEPKGVKLDTRTNNIGAAHVGIWVDDVDAKYRELKAAGVRFRGEPTSALPGRPRVAYFLDPDGITLELMQRQPK